MVRPLQCPVPAPATRPPAPLVVAVIGGHVPAYERLRRTGDLVLRHIRPPYTVVGGGGCDVVLLCTPDPAPDLLRRLGERVPPILMVSPATGARRITTALRLGVKSCLVDGDYDDRTLANALRSTAAGITVLSPAAVKALSGDLGRPQAGPARPESHGLRIRPSLSPREQQLMDLVASGLTVAEISKRMTLAVKTVRNYLSAIYTKLGVSSRTEAAVLWLGATARPRRPAEHGA
ncbi:response regulator transcription factor [Streptomyces ipomoeae]|uniref:Response regulator transcription factor n=1 Tax=Streptomyces ipomoeae TaxID=103232 RepID=A0AAE8W702_9ACTN|nr:response regulator transcription factor [Streptomyces ipomoeae]MDX2692010.1 response regulator transcription factor [Streptomyces ipomoeae]MDX2823114.1 response regulator transcription factor [Streptomyces ipomoeae]MDX2840586.1 response regulator transcription factor [Streptomyces ipomoeae]MDX2874835.1 response regulator transcription factor [Streptomyces ipomoeae]TQE31005.1 response regulator transcription factor [Streptomyces ipomoeae]